MNNSAGILPISRNEHGDVVFLLGKDSRDGVFSDFGGKSEPIDNCDPVNTATREFYEETLGCLCNSPHSIRERVKKMSVTVNGTTKKGNMYTMFLIEVPYIPDLPLRFKKIVNFLKYKNIGSAYIEKSELVWVSFEEMFKIPKRQVFSDTISSNATIIRKVITEPWRTMIDENIITNKISPSSPSSSSSSPPDKYKPPHRSY